jgi:hypothetical protein
VPIVINYNKWLLTPKLILGEISTVQLYIFPSQINKSQIGKLVLPTCSIEARGIWLLDRWHWCPLPWMNTWSFVLWAHNLLKIPTKWLRSFTIWASKPGGYNITMVIFSKDQKNCSEEPCGLSTFQRTNCNMQGSCKSPLDYNQQKHKHKHQFNKLVQ